MQTKVSPSISKSIEKYFGHTVKMEGYPNYADMNELGVMVSVSKLFMTQLLWLGGSENGK